MFMGYLGIALGARRLSKSLPLWLLLVAAILPDAADAMAGTLGSFTPLAHWVDEHSHTLLGIAGLAAAMGLLGWLLTRSGLAASVIAGAVVSHLPADYLTSRIPAWRGGPVIGLALYLHPWADFLVESTVIVAGLYFYRQSLEEVQRGPGILAAMLATLIGFQLVVDLIVFS